MRKFLAYIVLLLAIASSCRKQDDHLFSESPDERLAKKLSSYQEQLSGAVYGWKMVILPAGGGAYGFYVRFNNENRVQMVSDFDSASAVTLKESSYRLKALQQPSLIFDTYSYVHVLSDPDPNVNGGDAGAGLRSDFEFYFNDSSGVDTIQLTGRFNGSKAILTKATQQEAEAYTDGEFNIDLVNENLAKILQYFKRLTIGSNTYDININPLTKTVIFTWADANGNIRTFTTAFYFTLTGMGFQYPFVIDGSVITGFSDISWTNATSTINLTAGNTPATIKGAVKPLVIDLNGPRRWWQSAVDADAYWASLDGFHVNGADDAYGVTAIPKYAFMIFWPRYGTSGGINYDLTGFVTDEPDGLSLNFGAATRPPNFTSDGRIIFTNLGTLGEVPPEAEAAFNATADKFGQSSGFYLVQTSDGSYDMVSASDAKSWVTWLQGW
jgi:hypothetical protein